MNCKIKSLYLCVNDMARAVKFYEFFFEQKALIKDDIYSVFDIRGFRLGLFAYQKMKENHTFGSNCLPSIEVDSLQVLKEKIAGLEICFPLTKIGDNYVAEFVDSEGNHIEITTPIISEKDIVMKTYHDLIFEELLEEDIPILTPIMKQAFDEDTKMHLGQESGGPTGYDNGDFLRRYAINDKTSTAYKISQQGKIIGAIILWINKETKQNYLGNLFIDSAHESKGIGKLVWDFIEQEYPDTKAWQTDTPIFSRRNHHFYVNKCGFHVIKIKHPKDLEEGSYVLEKRMKGEI